MSSCRPIVVVTGANGGVGFGICYRLLLQLAQKQPSDAQPQLGTFATNIKTSDVHIPSSDSLTLIMACRSTKRAEAARTKLFSLLDAYIAKQKKKPSYDGHAQVFRQNLNIQIHYLDLAVIDTVFRFANELLQKYPYVSHLICNAGVASFSGIDWPAAFGQLLRNPMAGVTAPEYYRQNRGELSVDGLGWVWQCNIFGHYVLFRTIQPLLSASRSSFGSRVIWMSSLEASPKFYEAEDWQLIKTEHSYEGSKYQIDLFATLLDQRALKEPTESKRTRHFVVQPGVASTNISNALVGWFLDIFKVITFYLARLFGSPHHTIDPFKAAIAAVHLSLVPFSFIPSFSATSSNGHLSQNNAVEVETRHCPVRYGSETRRWGEEKVGVTEVKEWKENEREGLRLLDKCEALFQSLAEAEGESQVERASEHM